MGEQTIAPRNTNDTLLRLESLGLQSGERH